MKHHVKLVTLEIQTLVYILWYVQQKRAQIPQNKSPSANAPINLEMFKYAAGQRSATLVCTGLRRA